MHNLYRNSFAQVVFHKDNLAMEKRPEQWALDFGQTFSDAVSLNSGPALARAITRLLQHPQYRDAHVSTSIVQFTLSLLIIHFSLLIREPMNILLLLSLQLVQHPTQKMSNILIMLVLNAGSEYYAAA